jgi:hypothetical protein
MWGALSDERTGLSFTIAAGPRQRSHFRIRVPWDSWPYFTVSDSRLPSSSPSKTGRATVEVFDLRLLITHLHGPSTKHRLQQYLCYYMRIRCLRNVFTEPFANNGCFSGFKVLALSKYATICSTHKRTKKNKQNLVRKPEMKRLLGR